MPRAANWSGATCGGLRSPSSSTIRSPAAVRARGRSSRSGRIPPNSPNIILPHAHNLYLQTAAELGVVGLAALALVVLVAGRILLAAWRDGSPTHAAHAAGAIVGLTAFAGQALVDNVANLPFVCLLVLFVVAWVDGTADRPRVEDSPWARLGRLERNALVPAVALVAMALALPTLVRIDGARAASVRGGEAALARDWPTALSLYDEAAAADPDLAYYRIQLASALARVGRESEARAELAAVTQQDPLAVNLVSLATLDLAAGDVAAARAHATRAMELGVGEPTVALTAGVIEEQTGDAAIAIERFASAVAANPPLASAAFWEDPVRLVSKEQVIERARVFSDPLTAALILAYAGDAETATVELEAQPPSPTRDLYLAATVWRSGDVLAAQQQLADHHEGQPDRLAGRRVAGQDLPAVGRHGDGRSIRPLGDDRPGGRGACPDLRSVARPGP